MSIDKSRDALASYLGKIVSVSVDRSARMGTSYAGVFFRGSGQVPVYVIGIKNPSAYCSGRVIGLIYNNRENSLPCHRPRALVIAPPDVKMNQAQIAEAIFGEADHDTYHIEPLFHKSCGAIVYRHGDHGLEFLLLNELHSEKWGFPKGHMECGESEEETACREIYEEAGFHPTLRPEFREEIRYRISAVGEKSVIYFLSEYDGPIHVRKNEISAYTWITSEHAKAYLHRSNLIRIIEKASEIVLGTSSAKAL